VTVLPFKFLTNHGLALLCVAEDPDMRIRDIARDLEITERAAQRIVGDLVQAGYLERARIGRRNHYVVAGHLPLSLPMQRVMTLSSVMGTLSGSAGATQDAGTPQL
jgi:predicted DNA-binding transcriptional regulator